MLEAAIGPPTVGAYFNHILLTDFFLGTAFFYGIAAESIRPENA
jgi:hypothetical protein